MNKTYFTPGPSQLYPTVESALRNALAEGVPSISHRSAAFKAIFQRTTEAVRALLNVPEDYHVLYLSSATEIWERLLQSYPGPGFFFVNGNFSSRFRDFARKMGRIESSVEAPLGEGFPMGRIHIPDGTVFCGMIGNETSTGVATPADEYHAIAERFPNPVHFVDLVSGYPSYQLDLSKVDGAYFSVQKGFGLPAGLGVLLISNRALEMVREAEGRGEYRGVHRSFVEMARRAQQHQTPETPNVLGMYLLGNVVEDMLARGAELHESSRRKAELLYQYFDAHSRWQPAVDTPRWRSESVIVLDAPEQSRAIAAQLEAQGLVIGLGYSDRKDDQLRIANFPATSVADVERLIDAFRAL